MRPRNAASKMQTAGGPPEHGSRAPRRGHPCLPAKYSKLTSRSLLYSLRFACTQDSEPLENWLLWESNGYPENVEVPDYRMWELQLKGHFFGPFGSGIQNAPIPLVCVPEGVRGSYERYECRQSVASIEATVKLTSSILQDTEARKKTSPPKSAGTARVGAGN